MSEQTALLLASLSHRWFWLVALLPICCGAALRAAGTLQYRGRVSLNSRMLRLGRALSRVSLLLLVSSCLLFIVAFFHVGCASIAAHGTQCLSNTKRLGESMLLYAADYDEHLPVATRWSEAISPRVQATVQSDENQTSDPFRCPAAESPGSYGMNAALEGRSISAIESPNSTVLLFEADAPARSYAGGKQNVAVMRHASRPNFALADGHAKAANAFVQTELNWF
jgi:prepilin-type processing-associated H-X9-DG protein